MSKFQDSNKSTVFTKSVTVTTAIVVKLPAIGADSAQSAPTSQPNSECNSKQVTQVVAAVKEGICQCASTQTANVSEKKITKHSDKPATGDSLESQLLAINFIGGMKAVMSSVWSTISFPLKCPDLCRLIGPSRGLILHGPTGIGKTLLIEALVDGCTRYKPKISAFVNDRYSVDTNAYHDLAKLFDAAKKFHPSVIFLDNFDGFVYRGSPNVQVLASLMDALDNSGKVFVVAATRHLDLIDPALRKFGRFDSEIFLELPDLEARKDILRRMAFIWNLKQNLIDAVATETPGFTGADMGSLCRKAFVTSVKRNCPDFIRHLFHDDAEYDAECPPLDFSKVTLELEDFKEALRTVHSTSQRQQNYNREYLGLTCSTKVDLKRRSGRSKSRRM